MSTTADEAVTVFEKTGRWPGDPTGAEEPAEFDCPDCHGPAHCRSECDRRFAARQRDIDAWHAWYRRARCFLPEDSFLVEDGDRLMEPF